MFRPCHVVVGALALMAAACSDNNNLAPVTIATVRLVNDTDTPLSFANAVVVDSADAKIAFGHASTCASVDLSNPARELTITNGTTRQSIAAPSLSAGANLLIVAFVEATGNVQLAALSNRFTPSSTGAGLRFFNGISSIRPLFMDHEGDLTGFVEFGAASPFVSVRTDSISISFATATSVVLDPGFLAFSHGKNSTVVLGPPAPGTSTLRFSVVQGC